jgi:two-component system OmpR family response regulator
MERRRIAIVEDEADIARNYQAALEREGFRVDHYPDRASASTAFESRLPDAVIIDVTLGADSYGGFELCRELRTRSETLPIVFLTARDDELDYISGLHLGADDYLTKDVSLKQLVVRMITLFRRMDVFAGQHDPDTRITQGALSLDPDRMYVRWRDTHVPLSLTEFWMVHALARRPGHVKTRQQLMDAAETVLDDSTVTSHVRRIRRKFEALDAKFDAIETVHAMGYRWRSDALE